MSVSQPFSEAYLESKRAQLAALRERLIATNLAAEAQARDLLNSTESAREAEDDAQKIDLLDSSRSLERHDAARLSQIERALRKIEEGTYGFSDISGHRIPIERLDALPEATITLEEQAARE